MVGTFGMVSPQLWVLWSRPSVLPGTDGTILSFLPPAVEDEVERESDCRLIRAREASLKVRDEARASYIELIARIGTVPDEAGRSFRKVLAGPNRTSVWWYHPAAFKDCEADPALRWIIAVLTIKQVATDAGVRDLIMFSAPAEVAAALGGAFRVIERGRGPVASSWLLWLRGAGSRAKYLFRALVHLRAVCKQSFDAAGRGFAVLFAGFWDWSVRWEQNSGTLTDRYFRGLPAVLNAKKGGAIGWLTWLDPGAEPGMGRRSLRNVLAPLEGCDQVIILQSFLRVLDVVCALADLRPLFTFLRFRRRRAFRDLFRQGAVDYYPLLSRQLLEGFLDSSLPHYTLVALATERACRRLKPSVLVTFLEHFPFSRAQYEGVRRAGTGTTTVAVQHASYNHEKTFLALHPDLEFAGRPDGCAVPRPDSVCAMGTLGRDLFLECGYESSRVLLTGSPRYDHVRLSAGPQTSGRLDGRSLRILIVTSLDVETEMDLIEAAWFASRDLAEVRLFLRNHPFARVEQHSRFARYADRITITTGSLEEDVEQADLILFTYSTVAEEAFLRGKPVWQWLPLGFNGSALAEAAAIPQYGSVSCLRQAIEAFRSDPARFTPSLESREAVLERLYFAGDGRAAERVATVIRSAVPVAIGSEPE